MLRKKVKDLGNEKKTLITRLMQINFLVDDHVYNDKRIPATEAQAHIEELSSYNVKKYSDVRILQVTEKLLRCMKRIIVEEQEVPGLATQYVSESIDDKESNTKNIINVPPHSELNIQCNVSATIVDIENRNINNNSTKTPIEENKVNKVSDPNENAENVIDDIPIDESQCVLHNNAKEHEVVTNTITNELNNKTGNKINEVVKTEIDRRTELCMKNNKDIKNKFNLKTERKKRTSKSTFQKKIEQKAKVSKPRISKNKCTQKIKTDILKNTELKEKITSVEPKFLQVRAEFVKNSIDNLETNSNTETLRDARKMVIYKKTTVDDLSWIEDIRYVREIDSQEFDEKNNILDDVFWNDSTLPPNLSEEDFTV